MSSTETGMGLPTGIEIIGKIILLVRPGGGLTVSYYAYQKSLEGKERVDIDGFTPEQRFFIAFGQIWKGNYTDEAMLQQIRTNHHSPNSYRVLGTLSQMPEFYEAFGCKVGDEMHTEDKVRAVIW